MPDDRAELVERFLEAYNARDYETLEELLHPSAEWHGNAHQPDEPRVLCGPDEFIRRLKAREAEFDVFRTDIREKMDAGDRVLVVFDVTAKGKRSGVSVTFTDASVWTFTNDRISRIDICASREAALELSGLEA